MKFENLPDDIHYHIINNIKYNIDLINLSKMNNNLKKQINNNTSKIKVNLFKINLIFNIVADLNKHCRLCKKFKNLKYYFNEQHFKISFDRKTNHTIFDTSTLVYISIFIHDIVKFNNKFLTFLHQNDLYKMLTIDNIRFDILVYLYKDSFIGIKKEIILFDRQDILLDSNTNINLDNINFSSYNFVDIQDMVNKDSYKILKINLIKEKKNFIKYLINCKLIIISKELILFSLNSISSIQRRKKENLNDMILEEFEQINPNIERVDKLVNKLNEQKKLINYTKNISLYLINNNIKITNFPYKE